MDILISKIQNDIKHAKGIEPDYKQLYLISNQYCKENRWPEITNIIKDCRCEIYDNRRLANNIYNYLTLKDAKIDELAVFLPKLNEIRNESISDYALPIVPKLFLEDRQVQLFLDKTIEENKCIFFYGVSGSGKTTAMIKHARQKFNEYESVIWIDYKDIDGKSFNCVLVRRLGHQINLLHRFTSCKCLLVIDDCYHGISINQFQEFEEGFSKGSKLVILSKIKCSEDIPSVEFPKYSDAIAKDMLTEGIEHENQDSIISNILFKTYNNPFLLRFINESVKEKKVSWSDVDEIFNQMSEIQTEKNEYFISKLLREYSGDKKEHLDKLAWLGTQVISIEFLHKFLGIVVVQNLEKRLIIGKLSDYYYKVHDLVMTYLRSCDDFECNARNDKYVDSFWDALAYVEEEHPYTYHNNLSLLSDVLQKIAKKSQPIPSKQMYQYLKVEDCDIEIAKIIADEALSDYHDDEMAMLSIIEANEQLYVKARREEKGSISEKLVRKIDDVIEKVSDTIKKQLKHHKAKSLFRMKMYDEAWKLFVENYSAGYDKLSTSLQIARLAVKINRKRESEIYHKGSECLREIIKTIMDPNLRKNKSVTHLISGMVLIREYPDIEEEYCRNEDFVNSCRTLLIHCLMADNNQSLEGLVIFSRMTWYEFPSALVELEEYVKIPQVGDIKARIALSIADIFKNIGKAYGEINDKTSMQNCCRIAQKYYEHPDIEKSCYMCTMIAENQIILEGYRLAKDSLDIVPDDERNEFWYHRHAQLQYEMKNFNDALDSIEQALSKSDASKYNAAFLKLQGDIFYSLQEYERALDSYREAKRCTKSDKFKEDIQHIIGELSNC